MKGLSRSDFLVLSMARAIPDGATVATGVLSWLPMLAIALAQHTHASALRYLNCAGAIDPRLHLLAPSSTDARLLTGNAYCLRLTDLWDLASRGRIDVMFFGFAQLDCNGNTNSSQLRGIHGRVRKLPGVAGAFALRQLVKNPVLFSTQHSSSVLVPRVEAVTTVAPRHPVLLLTNLGVFQLARRRLEVVSLHPTVGLDEVEEKTGFAVRPPRRLRTTSPPSIREWGMLEKLDGRRTRKRCVKP